MLGADMKEVNAFGGWCIGTAKCSLPVPVGPEEVTLEWITHVREGYINLDIGGSRGMHRCGEFSVRCDVQERAQLRRELLATFRYDKDRPCACQVLKTCWTGRREIMDLRPWV